MRFRDRLAERTLKRYAAGYNAVQALELAMNMIGITLYTSEKHEDGRLEWLEPGDGYGFPVTRSVCDLLIGRDRHL